MTVVRPTAASGVECLSQMPDCELADGAPDVRGWELTSPTSAHLGVVKDLLVDLSSMHVRYLDVVLDAEPGVGRRVLMPIGTVWISDALDQVVVPDTSLLDALPDYDRASFNRDFEHRLLAGFGELVGAEADFYANRAFDGARFRATREPANCGRREHDTSGACPGESENHAPEAANGVELPVVADAAAD